MFRTPIIGETMPNGRRFVSMRMKFVGVMLITGIAVLLLALIAIPLSLRFFQKHHTEPERVDERLQSYVEDFATYVAEEKITSDDTDAIVAWTRRHRSVYLTIFTGRDDHFGAAGGELWEGEDQPDMAPFFDELISSEGSVSSSLGTEGNMYDVLFANGIHSVAVVDYSLSTGTDTILILGVLPGWNDYLRTDYVIYTGEISVTYKLRNRYIELEDGTVVRSYDLSEFDSDDTFGTVIYAKRTGLYLGGSSS